LRFARTARAGECKHVKSGTDTTTPNDEKNARDIIARYDDKDFSLCDAISFAVMERRSARIAFAFDSHFRQYRRFTILGVE
jgi:predicted nucleic acid-binding protein